MKINTIPPGPERPTFSITLSFEEAVQIAGMQTIHFCSTLTSGNMCPCCQLKRNLSELVSKWRR